MKKHIPEIEKIFAALSGHRFILANEKQVQAEVGRLLQKAGISFLREAPLGPGNIIDFLVDNRIGIEVKLKGPAKGIFRQCRRYCASGQLAALVLLTNKPQGFPASINGISCYCLNMGTAWL